MATKYSVRVCFKNEDSKSIALLSNAIPRESIVDFVDSLWGTMGDWQNGEDSLKLKWIDCIDMDTGRIIYERTDWDEPADIDSDCGFDPYLGCFTDDC